MSLLNHPWMRHTLTVLTLLFALLCMNPDLILPYATAAGYGTDMSRANPGAHGDKHALGEKRPKIDFVKELGVDSKTADAVKQVLRSQREKHWELDSERDALRERHGALRAETDQKLAKLLNTAQIERLHQLRPRPH